MKTFVIISTLFGVISTFPSGPYPAPVPVPLTPFNNANEITNNKIRTLINSKAFPITPHFPDSGRKHAVLEQESLVSQKDSAYQNLQNFVASFYNPQPVIDTISEYEKYGNDGGKIRSASTAVIAGFEAFSNLLNAAIDVPTETLRQLGKKFSATASSVGAKIAGL